MARAILAEQQQQEQEEEEDNWYSKGLMSTRNPR